MTQPETPEQVHLPSDELTKESRFITRRVRRRALHERLRWLVWGVALLVLLEFAIASHQEQEWQAATIAGALFLVILVAGILANTIWRIEAEEQDKYH
jgi:hypothetical protein